MREIVEANSMAIIGIIIGVLSLVLGVFAMVLANHAANLANHITARGKGYTVPLSVTKRDITKNRYL
jgi:hypothetical protein